MNIVHIEDFFHPDAGYQINVLPKYMVKQGHKVTIITSKMNKIPRHLTDFFSINDIEKKDFEYSEKTGINIIRLHLITYISGRAVFTHKLFQIVENLDPDIIYIHGNDTLTAMRYLIKFKRINAPIIMDSHMLEMASVNRFNIIFRALYRIIFTPIIVKNSITIIRTQDDDYVERILGIPLNQCPWISVGTDTMLFHPDYNVRAAFRKRTSISDDDFVIIYTGKLDEVKGGLLLSQAFRENFNIKKSIVLIVVGNANGEYGRMVEYTLSTSENRIIRFPTQRYIDLAQFYQAADLAIFPKQCSLSFYDAQACGLPVISEDNNVNIDRLRCKNGLNFESNSIESIREKALEFLQMETSEFRQYSDNALNYIKENYDYEEISRKYIETIVLEYKKYKNLRGL